MTILNYFFYFTVPPQLFKKGLSTNKSYVHRLTFIGKNRLECWRASHFRVKSHPYIFRRNLFMGGVTKHFQLNTTLKNVCTIVGPLEISIILCMLPVVNTYSEPILSNSLPNFIDSYPNERRSRESWISCIQMGTSQNKKCAVSHD